MNLSNFVLFCLFPVLIAETAEAKKELFDKEKWVSTLWKLALEGILEYMFRDLFCIWVSWQKSTLVQISRTSTIYWKVQKENEDYETKQID